jgi:tRNA1(Val) A37 N6-methylase TrmN6
MNHIPTMTEALVRVTGSPEGAAKQLGVSLATVLRWRSGKGLPRPAQERKLLQIVESAQALLPLDSAIDAVNVQVENVVRSILNDFRETLHRYSRFSHRNDSLDFLAKVLFAHVTDKDAGGPGLSGEMLSSDVGPALTLRKFVENRLRASLPASLSYELAELSKTLSISAQDNDFATQVIKIFAQPFVDEVFTSLIKTHRLDLLNDIFGRFVTDSFVEEKELAQYLTPPEVVKLMALLGAKSLSPKIWSELTSAKNDKLILDPSCGVGSFLVAGIHSVAQLGEDVSKVESILQSKVVGIDKSERMAQLAITNLALLGARKTNVILGNSLDRRSSNSISNLKGKAALILTNPPFGASFSASEIGRYELLNDRSNGRVDSELLFIERYVEWLCPGGVLVAIVPDSLLTNKGIFQRTRAYVAEYCDILSVVSLPPVTFAAAGTTTKTSIIHVRKRSSLKEQSKSLATYFALCEQVGYDVVTRGAQRRKIFKDDNDLPAIMKEAGRDVVPVFGCLADINGDTERWDAKFNMASIDAHFSNKTTMRVGEFADLVSDKMDPRRLPGDEFEYIEISDVDDRFGMVWSKRTPINAAPSRARKRVKLGDVLMSTVRPERGCVGVVPPELDDAICSTGFAVLRPKKNMNPYLLAFLLKSRTVMAQVERQMSGIAYPAINESAIPDLFLPTDLSRDRKLGEVAKHYMKLAEDLGASYRNLSKILAG